MKFWQKRKAGKRFAAWLIANGVQTVELTNCKNCRKAVVSLDDLPWIHAPDKVAKMLDMLFDLSIQQPSVRASLLDTSVKCLKPVLHWHPEDWDKVENASDSDAER